MLSNFCKHTVIWFFIYIYIYSLNSDDFIKINHETCHIEGPIEGLVKTDFCSFLGDEGKLLCWCYQCIFSAQPFLAIFFLTHKCDKIGARSIYLCRELISPQYQLFSAPNSVQLFLHRAR